MYAVITSMQVQYICGEPMVTPATAISMAQCNTALEYTAVLH